MHMLQLTHWDSSLDGSFVGLLLKTANSSIIILPLKRLSVKFNRSICMAERKKNSRVAMTTQSHPLESATLSPANLP